MLSFLFCRWRRARQWDRAGQEDIVNMIGPCGCDRREQNLKVVFFTFNLLIKAYAW